MMGQSVVPAEILEQSSGLDDNVNDVEKDDRYLAMQARYTELGGSRRN